MFSYKFITIGDAGVGKTALVLRYAYNSYSHTDMTIGVDFAIKQYTGGKVQIWDTSGQESFRSISRSYYHGANAALLVFDLNNKKSFQKIKHWYEDFRSTNNDAICVLVGTKCDLIKNRNVSQEEIMDLRDTLGLKYFETSASHGISVREPFNFLINELKLTQNRDNKTIQLQNSKEVVPRINSCCT